jgi:hypothetical protein
MTSGHTPLLRVEQAHSNDRLSVRNLSIGTPRYVLVVNADPSMSRTTCVVVAYATLIVSGPSLSYIHTWSGGACHKRVRPTCEHSEMI